MDQHEIIQELKRVASELGRTPSRDDWRYKKPSHISHDGILRVFGTWSAAIQAAGLEPLSKPRKIDRTVFERDIARHLEAYEAPAPIKPHPYPDVCTVSDIHWPFASDRVLASFATWCEKRQPEYVVLNGDAWDMYSHSKYPRSHNLFTPREEQASARKSNEDFWREIQKRCPKTKCVQMIGNHDLRPLKRVLEAYPAAEDWIEKIVAELFSFDGVKTFFDSREEFILGNTAIFHGYLSKLGGHRDHTLMNTINGHTHRGGTVFRQLASGLVVFELNSGFAGDPLSKGLTYTPQRITGWTPGFGDCDLAGPRFIPA